MKILVQGRIMLWQENKQGGVYMSRVNEIKKLSAKTQDIVDDLLANVSVRAIAKKYDVSCQYIYKVKARLESKSWN